LGNCSPEGSSPIEQLPIQLCYLKAYLTRNPLFVCSEEGSPHSRIITQTSASWLPSARPSKLSSHPNEQSISVAKAPHSESNVYTFRDGASIRRRQRRQITSLPSEKSSLQRSMIIPHNIDKSISKHDSVIYIQNTCHYISLNFIISLHQTNGIHEICLHLQVYTLKKKYRRSENLSRHRDQTPIWGTNDLFIEGDLPEIDARIMGSEQATICLDISSHPSKVVRPISLTAMTLRKPSEATAAPPQDLDGLR